MGGSEISVGFQEHWIYQIVQPLCWTASSANWPLETAGPSSFLLKCSFHLEAWLLMCACLCSKHVLACLDEFLVAHLRREG